MTAIAYQPDPGLSFWPTPPEVADDLVYAALCPGYGDGSAAGGCPQIRILEPSAGDGHLARAVRRYLPGAHITAVEPAAVRAASLRSQDGLVDEVVESTLEDFLVGVALTALVDQFEPYELVIMNPPFTLKDRPEVWAEHVLAVCTDPHLVNPGGVVAAVVPRIILTGKSKLTRAVRALIGDSPARYPDGALRGTSGQIDPCEKGAFAAVDAGVSTALLWFYKPILGE